MQEIRALAGLRLLTASALVAGVTWLTHRSLLMEHFPDRAWIIDPVVRQGHVAAGLFFCLSGFVLAHRYLDRLTPQPHRRGPELRRYALRRAVRLWPAYLVGLHLMMALQVARTNLTDASATPPIDSLAYLRQLLLVQVWGEPDHAGTSWLGIGWALSALLAVWLAFPLLAVLVERVERVTAPGTRLTFACLLAVPVAIVMTPAWAGTGEYQWVLLAFSYFLAGMVTAGAVRDLSSGAVTLCSPVLVGVALVAVATAGFVTLVPTASAKGMMALVPVPVVATAAAATGPAAKVLGNRFAVAGAGISYGLMLLHFPVIAAHSALMSDAWAHEHPRWAVATMAGAVGVSALLAVEMRRVVEEPLLRSIGASTPSEPPSDAGSDTGSDAGTDAGTTDAGSDGPPAAAEDHR